VLFPLETLEKEDAVLSNMPEHRPASLPGTNAFADQGSLLDVDLNCMKQRTEAYMVTAGKAKRSNPQGLEQ